MANPKEIVEIYSKLGSYLRSKRVQAKIKQHELAAALGYKSPQFVSNWERGLCSPPLDQLSRILLQLNVDRNEFIQFYVDLQKDAISEIVHQV